MKEELTFEEIRIAQLTDMVVEERCRRVRLEQRISDIKEKLGNGFTQQAILMMLKSGEI